MNRNTAEEILERIGTCAPALEAAVFDREGKMVCSLPKQIKHVLPSGPAGITVKGRRFSGAVEAEDGYVIAYTGRKEQGEPEMYQRLIDWIAGSVLKKRRLQQRAAIRNDASSVFVDRLLNVSTEIDRQYLDRSAEFHGYDLMLKRMVILLDFVKPGQVQDLPVEVTDSAVRAIRAMPEIKPQDFFGKLGDHQIVICKSFGAGKDGSGIREEEEAFAGRLRKIFPAEEVRISLGSVCSEPEQYSTGLSHAQSALSLADRFGCASGICYFDDYLTEYEISALPEETLHHFFGDFADKVLESSWMFDTLEALVQSSMNQKEAAARLFIHRNTLVFRFNQLRELLQLDPYHSDGERFTLIAFYIYMKLYRRGG